MRASVTAILVVRDGGGALERTLEHLAAQTRRLDRLVAVEVGGSGADRTVLEAASPDAVLQVSRRSFGDAVAAAVRQLPPTSSDDEWLWLLRHDNAPRAGALEALIGAVEVAPSVAVAGPKLVRADDPAVMQAYGESLTPRGESVQLVEDELDQAQHDRRSDVLAVAASGMLVRRAAWEQLEGFDHGLPNVDASLDFCLRARLAGFRVVGVPAAKVDSVGGPELFDRPRAGAGTRRRLERTARWHRRLVYAGSALPLIWLSLVPAAVLRSLGYLVVGRPTRIPSELAAGFAAAFDGSVPRARRRFRATRRVGWSAVAPLRVTPSDLQERRAADAPLERDEVEAHPRFLSGGGVWAVLAALAVSLVVFASLLGAGALTGGGMLPLSDVGRLWSDLLYGTRPTGLAVFGAADPFSAVLAVLGTFTAWSPSVALVALVLLAMPLAALGAWCCAAAISTRAWPTVVAAIGYGVAPPLLAALTQGRPAAVIAHLVLPFLLLAVLRSLQSWAAAGCAALLTAVLVACAPVLVPAAAIAWIVLLATRFRALPRLLLLPIPAAVLALPLVLDQALRGRPLALLADPGLPVPFALVSGGRLAAGMPPVGGGSADVWSAAGAVVGLDAATSRIVVALLLVPLALVAVVAPFWRPTALAPLGLAVLGLATAVAGERVATSLLDGSVVAIWPGTGLSLFLIGLLLAATMTLSSLPRLSLVPAVVVLVAGLLAATPLAASVLTGGLAVRPSSTQQLPAFVTAEAQRDPRVGTLVIRPQSDGEVSAEVQRGTGSTLNELSTLVTTSRTVSASDARLAEVVGELVRGTSTDAAARLAPFGIDFVLLDRSDRSASDASERARFAAALDATPQLVAVGESSAGALWRTTSEAAAAPADEVPGVAWLIAAVQVIVFALFLLLALPVGSRRPRAESPTRGSAFDEDDDD